jgi:adenine/guanine phosphoribosyltransferase-like PRPP-binding protein
MNRVWTRFLYLVSCVSLFAMARAVVSDHGSDSLPEWLTVCSITFLTAVLIDDIRKQSSEAEAAYERYLGYMKRLTEVDGAQLINMTDGLSGDGAALRFAASELIRTSKIPSDFIVGIESNGYALAAATAAVHSLGFHTIKRDDAGLLRLVPPRPFAGDRALIIMDDAAAIQAAEEAIDVVRKAGASQVSVCCLGTTSRIAPSCLSEKKNVVVTTLLKD